MTAQARSHIPHAFFSPQSIFNFFSCSNYTRKKIVYVREKAWEQVVEAWILFGPKAPNNEARVSFLRFYSQVYCVLSSFWSSMSTPGSWDTACYREKHTTSVVTAASWCSWDELPELWRKQPLSWHSLVPKWE